MKKLLLAIAVLVNFSATAQKTKVTESTERIGGGSNNALTVTILEAQTKDVQKEWKALMKTYNAKVSDKDEIFADNALITAIGNNTIDVYARAETQKDGNTLLIVGFDLGGAYLNSKDHSAQFSQAKKIIYDFAVKVTKEAVGEQIKVQEKYFDKLNDEQKALVKKNDGFKEDIENYKQKIKKAEDEIVKNNGEQDAKKKEIEAQRVIVEQIKSKEKAVD